MQELIINCLKKKNKVTPVNNFLLLENEKDKLSF